MEKLGINLVGLVAQLVNVGILLIVLKKFLYAPLLQLLEKRRVAIEEGVKNQETLEKKLKALEEKERQLNIEAKKKFDEVNKQALIESEKTTAAMLKQAKKQAESIIKEAQAEKIRQLSLVKTEQQKEIARQAAELASQALSKFLDPKDRIRITESQIQTLISAS